MPYREDLEAALARIAAAEDELAAARTENAHDHERIAELTEELAEARLATIAVEARSRPSPAPPPPAPPKPTTGRPDWWTPWLLLPLVIVTIVVSDEVVKHTSKAGGPTRIDVMAELSRAKADARKRLPDAVLLQMSTQSIGVIDARGFADLTKGFVTIDFFSPAQKRYVHVVFQQGGRRETTEPASVSGLRVHDPPHCSVIDVWDEAIRRGASPSSLASISLRNISTDGPAWTLEVVAPAKPFSMRIPDECPIAR